MKPTPFPHETEGPKLPSLLWLESTSVALNLALGLFAASNKLGHLRLLDWFAVNLLRCARRSLGHASAGSYLEFRADLSVQI